MSVLPGTLTGDLEFFENRVDGWIENAAAIGLTPAQAATLQTETNQARSAYDNTQAARIAAKDATTTQTSEFGEMRSFGGQLIRTIRAFAEQQPDPGAVYSLASIPAPSAPVSQPPENPYNITFELLESGKLELDWKGSANGGNASYTIERSTQNEPGEPFSVFEQVGITGSRGFIDSLPSCTIAATYIIKAYKGPFVTEGSTPTTARFTPIAKTDPGSQLRVA